MFEYSFLQYGFGPSAASAPRSFVNVDNDNSFQSVHVVTASLLNENTDYFKGPDVGFGRIEIPLHCLSCATNWPHYASTSPSPTGTYHLSYLIRIRILTHFSHFQITTDCSIEADMYLVPKAGANISPVDSLYSYKEFDDVPWIERWI